MSQKKKKKAHKDHFEMAFKFGVPVNLRFLHIYT